MAKGIVEKQIKILWDGNESTLDKLEKQLGYRPLRTIYGISVKTFSMYQNIRKGVELTLQGKKVISQKKIHDESYFDNNNH